MLIFGTILSSVLTVYNELTFIAATMRTISATTITIRTRRRSMNPAIPRKTENFKKTVNEFVI